MSHPPHPTPTHTPTTTPPPAHQTWAPTLPTLTSLTTHTHPLTLHPLTHPSTLHALALSAATTLRSAATQSELHQAAAIAVALEDVVAVHRVIRGRMVAAGDETARYGGDEAACVVCLIDMADVLMMPCQHLVLCSGCSGKMDELHAGQGGRSAFAGRRRNAGCPVCRGTVTEKVIVKRC